MALTGAQKHVAVGAYAADNKVDCDFRHHWYKLRWLPVKLLPFDFHAIPGPSLGFWLDLKHSLLSQARASVLTSCLGIAVVLDCDK